MKWEEKQSLIIKEERRCGATGKRRNGTKKESGDLN
jgi:hypothetical protein